MNREIILRLLGAAVVFVVALDGGSYSLSSRNSLAISLWWAVILAVALGLWPRVRTPLSAWVVGGLLGAFALLCIASITWGASSAEGITEFNRVALYIGAFTAVVVATGPSSAARWSDALAIGISAIAGIALVSRFFPGLFPERGIAEYLPGTETRLTFPIDYWNGLGVFLGLGVPLLVRAAVTASRPVWRGAALVPLPAIAAAIYLTSSRSAVLATAMGITVLAALTEHRWRVVGVLGVAAAGAAGTVAVLLDRDALVDGPVGSPQAITEGRSAAVLVAAICIVTGAGYGLVYRLLGGRLSPRPAFGWAMIGLLVIGVAAATAAASPLDRLEELRESPSTSGVSQDDFARSHLLSGGSSGRWQFWQVAIDAFQTRPLTGRGAGTYEAWWAQNATFDHFVRDAHSLYLEVLAELGIAGLVLLLGAFTAALAAGVSRLRLRHGEARVTTAALTASFTTFATAAAVDWLWEIPAVTLVAMVCLGLLAGPANAHLAPVGSHRASPRHWRFAGGVALLVAGWLVIMSEAVPLLTDAKLRDSQAAVERGDTQEALEDALAARTLQPWASAPHVQLALIEEQAGELDTALEHIRAARDRDSDDWRLWLISARIQTKAGQVRTANRSLSRARALNPRSPVFRSSR